jgi:hypothetical protein
METIGLARAGDLASVGRQMLFDLMAAQRACDGRGRRVKSVGANT